MFNVDPPEITTHPEFTVVEEGYYVTLTCYADGNPTPWISWTKDGSLVIGRPGVILGTGNRTLTIEIVNREDSGQYQCLASNGLGNATSSVATLDVDCKYTTKELAIPKTVTQ